MMKMSLKNLTSAANVSIEINLQQIESRISIISIFAVIGYPLYYLIWHNLYPQPYENLWLRLMGSALFFPLIFIKYWPEWANRHRAIYWYFVTLYGLPFFFTFMLLMNGASTIWLMSALIAVFFMSLIHSLGNLFVHFSLGTGIAALAYYLSDHQAPIESEYWVYLPIYFFAILGGGLLKFSNEAINQERLRAMLAATSNIAHELRTPLLGIKSGAAGLQNYLPALLSSYQLAKEHGLEVEPIRLAHINAMHGVLERIVDEADQSNIIIDMLLMNSRMDGYSTKGFANCSITRCVMTALMRYPFVSEDESKLVSWNDHDTDFEFFGSELLMTHVLFNLFKNALFQIAKAGKGKIDIQLKVTPQGNTLIFRDSATGIPPEVLPHIFTRFYSWSPGESSVGTGIGLAFCHSVMQAFGGTIRCESQYGEYTEFTLFFPSSTGDTP